MEDKESTNMPSEQPAKKRRSLPKWLTLLLVLLLLIAIGLIVWLWMTCQDEKKDLKKENENLHTQVDELNKKLKEATDTNEGDSDDSADVCPAVTDDLKTTIRDAVGSKNYAALESHMTSPITVIYAATEFGGPMTPDEAVDAMDYLNNGTAPWDFNLPAATVDGYRAGFYEDYFPANAYVGRSSDGLVVSFGFKCDKINQIFIAANEEIL